jgi:hypothetical protein
VYRLNTDNIDATIDIAKIRGFESLPLRQLEYTLRSRARDRAWDRARRTRRDENPGFGEAAGRTDDAEGIGPED